MRTTPRRIALSMLLAALAAWAPPGSSEVRAAARLTADEVRRVAGQAAAEAARLNLRAYIAVTDAEGNVLGLFRMAGASTTSIACARRDPADPACRGLVQRGLEGRALPADLVAITKAISGALLSSGGNAFSTRTASFIVQEHFPPAIDFTPGGPLFGVQISSLPCGDFKAPSSPLGLAGDPGGFPLYKDGVLAGGVGVEADGLYRIDLDPASLSDSDDALPEELAALAGTRGFEVPDLIRAERILADGIRLPYVNVELPGSAAGPVAALEVVQDAFGFAPAAPRDGVAPRLVNVTFAGLPGQTDPQFAAGGTVATRAGQVLTAADVAGILERAARQTAVTRAAIRQPLGSSARVSMAVVDLDGRVLGFFQNADAPNFGIDVAVQKARTANFFSSPGAADDLRRAGLGRYVTGEAPLDGSVAYTSRAVGFLAQPLYPPGIESTAEGPFSLPLAGDTWSPFNTGLQLDLVFPAVSRILTGGGVTSCSTDGVAKLPNGITIFPGGIPLYKNGVLAGAVGVSGDGVDQDDLIASAGATGFEAPPEKRCDQLVVRGARLPWVKFPRHPEL